MQSLQLTPAISVLVVDDDKVDRLKVRRLLNDICHLVDADSGQNALACLDTLQVNCVLLDYHMPGTDTLELLTNCVERQLPVVMITGEGDEAVVVEAITRGAQDYLNKNKLTQDTLCQTIVRAMEKVSLTRQVQEKQREMEAFVSMAAHDLKSPLRTMVNLCQLVQLRGQAALEAETAAQLDMAVNKGLHLLQFIDELLEYTRAGRSSKPFEPVNLAEILSSIQSSLAHAIEVSNAEITIGFLPTIQGDPTGLTQLFLK